MTTTSAPFYQIYAEQLVERLTRYREFVLGGAPIFIEERLKVDYFARM